MDLLVSCRFRYLSIKRDGESELDDSLVYFSLSRQQSAAKINYRLVTLS